ncbi:alpha/beta hydrolase [Flavobacterium capsici]|uniref:Alpha/beta hydrolase-fold protein n=1 Tax=Flavobacterium capsici TaxID=3075618 RepID=A0AA96F218_9FLAO|nr:MULTISPECIES: alpha/beta hydrolase-fold protein [unclassified Flavobacterium]WNM19790.1 alpha/beta hydrolase-fold protein [Flavobacterium sp. PMR2A8]WNM21179.1 alpha/beta hydrolase-fold protein [Flavobacterium sp. PMTSA4]
MKKLPLFLLMLFTCSLFSQKKITDTIFSNKLNEERIIQISLPPSYAKNKSQKFPLLVLFDGDFLFDAYQGALSYGYYWDDLPEVIIVAINQGNSRENDCAVNAETGLPEEKGEKFFEFVGMELIPLIEKNFRVAPFRIVSGLDVTAGFLNLYLYKDQPIFKAYISFSPELPTDMEKNLPERFAAIQQPIFYYHCTADGDLKKMRTRIMAMDEEIKKIKNPSLNYLFEDFKEASHYSVVLHAIPSALYQIFSVYQPISMTEFQEKIVKLPSGYAQYLKDKYELLEKSLGLKLQIRLNDFKAIEAAILKNNALNEFDELAQLADKDYPKSMLADYHMALMYEKKGDYAKAQKTYLRAFQREEIGDLTKDMMYEKSEDMKRLAPKKGKKGEVIEETPVEEIPAETPPETPTEEKKSE